MYVVLIANNEGLDILGCVKKNTRIQFNSPSRIFF